MVKGLGSMVAEENIRSLDSRLIVFSAVHHGSHFLRKTLLEGTLTWIGSLLGDECVDFLFGKAGENLDVLGSIIVADIEPELIEFVGRCAGGIAPSKDDWRKRD